MAQTGKKRQNSAGKSARRHLGRSAIMTRAMAPGVKMARGNENPHCQKQTLLPCALVDHSSASATRPRPTHVIYDEAPSLSVQWLFICSV